MEPQQYNRKPQPVVAVQYDGSTAGAYRLLGWLLGERGTYGHFRSGYDTQGPDGPVVVDRDGRDRFVLEHEWVVVYPGGGTAVLNPQAFAEEYEAVPQVKPQPAFHPGHGPGCRCATPRTSVATSREDG